MPSCIGKKGWDTPEDASRALELIRNSAEAWLLEKVPARYYECDICRRWHLTAMATATAGKKRKKR